MFGLFKKKPNAVITSVRYTGDRERLALVRYYGRRGAIWSDLELLSREELLARLKAGQKFVVGQRQGNVPGSFEIGKIVELRNANGEAVIRTEGTSGARDYLEGAPLF